MDHGIEWQDEAYHIECPVAASAARIQVVGSPDPPYMFCPFCGQAPGPRAWAQAKGKGGTPDGR